MFERRKLTNAFLVTVRTAGFPVGDAYVPDEQYGWSNTPNAPGSTFTPYLIVAPGNVTDIKGPLAYPHADMWIPYQVLGFGSTRDQCELVMDRMRDTIDALHRTFIECTNSRFKVAAVDTKSIGSIVRGGTDDAPIFGQTDTVTIFLSEELR